MLFDPGTAEFFQRNRNSEWNYEALSGAVKLGLDQNHAHVQPNGAYHYHGLPSKSLSKCSRAEIKLRPSLVGLRMAFLSMAYTEQKTR